MENPNQAIAQIGQIDQELNKGQMLSDAIEQTNAGDSMARRTMREMTITARPGELVPSLSAMEDARTSERATEIAIESAVSAQSEMTAQTLKKTKEMLESFSKLAKETKDMVGAAEQAVLDSSSPMFDPDAISLVTSELATLIGPDIEYGGDPAERFEQAAGLIMEMVTNQGIVVDGFFSTMSDPSNLEYICLSQIRPPRDLVEVRNIGNVTVRANSLVGPYRLMWLEVDTGSRDTDAYVVEREFASLHAYYDRPRNVEISDVLAQNTTDYYNAMGELGHNQILPRIENSLDDLIEQMKTLKLVCDGIEDAIEEYNDNTQLNMNKQVAKAIRQIMLFATNTHAICMCTQGFFEAIGATSKLLKLTKED